MAEIKEIVELRDLINFFLHKNNKTRGIALTYRLQTEEFIKAAMKRYCGCDFFNLLARPSPHTGLEISPNDWTDKRALNIQYKNYTGQDQVTKSAKCLHDYNQNLVRSMTLVLAVLSA